MEFALAEELHFEGVAVLGVELLEVGEELGNAGHLALGEVLVAGAGGAQHVKFYKGI